MAKRRHSYEESHRTVNGIKQKRCSKCKKWKKESEFYKTPSCKDGLNYSCKECWRRYGRMYYRRDGKSVRRHYTYEESHRVVGGVTEKRCRRCKKWKAESDFYKDLRYKDGLQGRCKKCANKTNKESRRKRLLAIKN